MISQLCPRGNVMVHIYDQHNNMVGSANNRLIKEHAPCQCNDNADTLKEGSKTCLAIHAEVLAVMDVWKNEGDWNDMHTLYSTRPPCRSCIKVLLATPIKQIIVTPAYDDRDGSQQVWESAGRKWRIT